MAIALVPDVPLVELDAVLAEQLPVFLLKRPRAMVLLLRLDVLQHAVEVTRAYRKRAVAALPEKPAILSIKRFYPFRGICL